MIDGTMRGMRWLGCLLLVAVLTACGGGGSDSGGGGFETVGPAETGIGFGNAELQTVLNAVPAVSSDGSVTPTTLTIHYRRPAGDYTGWTLHTWDAAVGTEWTNGRTPSSTDAFGAVYEVPLASNSGSVGYIFHKGDEKDHNNADQRYTLAPGKNEIWRVQGDATTYTSNPLAAATPDIKTLRVHYRRFDGNYAGWGLHLWNGSGLDVAGLNAGTVIEQWGAPVAFSQMPGYSAGVSEVVFDIPVLNPMDDANRTGLTFVLHGMPPNENNKDGWNADIRVDYALLKITNQVGEVWLVQGEPTVYTSVPDTRSASTKDARAFWLNRQLVQWPKLGAGGTVKLYHSATGQIVAPLDGTVRGADGFITLDLFTGTVPSAAATRFKWIDAGAVYAVKDADLARLPTLHKSQLVLVQEDATGNVQNATTTQTPGALDDLYAAAANLNDFGVTISGGNTKFRLWAPTAQKVYLFTYDTPTSPAATVDQAVWDAATGSWTVQRSGDLSGKTYRYAVEVFVRGVGLVRNLVTDPYSVSLTADSQRSLVANLASADLKPAGWDASTVPAKVAANTDMVVYELHVRDFSVSDATVSAANRGKYLAFTEAGSNGMKHLKALADAGVTDVHLLPVFDIASVPEVGCSTPAPSGAADAETQQAAVGATKDADCFNWGYDPWHFNAPEGSYASDAMDGSKRIREFRQMVMGLHAAGLRVGMDVVYNHTTASGQNAKSVLDRVVPGYYHRLDASGTVTNSTCCDNTATEHLMMAKLTVDSVALWAREYKIASFRFDLMGHMPRSVIEQAAAAAKAATGREVQMFGEGWNFGEVANGARFVQATQGGMGGSGVGTFGDRMRDAVRGGGCCDSGSQLVSNQGWINGLWYDPNPQNMNRPLNDLRWYGDLIKGALAGSITDYTLTTHWDAVLPLKDLNNVGYATQPGEVVNYVENHDNQTLFDVNAMKLPTGTSREDRARVQLLGTAIVALSQGTAYFHAGVDVLRSKSLDRNSYNSGDWFNRLDWTYADNNFGVGLPPAADNSSTWPLMKDFLANAAIKPQPGDVAWMRDAFRDLMRIRSGTTLLRLKTADEIKARLTFHNLGSGQLPTVLAASIDGTGYAGANYQRLAYLINAGTTEQTLRIAEFARQSWELHPVQAAATAADRRVALGARVDTDTGDFTVPARSAAVFVIRSGVRPRRRTPDRRAAGPTRPGRPAKAPRPAARAPGRRPAAGPRPRSAV